MRFDVARERSTRALKSIYKEYTTKINTKSKANVYIIVHKRACATRYAKMHAKIKHDFDSFLASGACLLDTVALVLE